jgi:hypothetical protein
MFQKFSYYYRVRRTELCPRFPTHSLIAEGPLYFYLHIKWGGLFIFFCISDHNDRGNYLAVGVFALACQSAESLSVFWNMCCGNRTTQPCADLLEKRAALDWTLNYCCLVSQLIILCNRRGELKRSGREIERSPSSSAEISNAVLIQLHGCVRLIGLVGVSLSTSSALLWVDELSKMGKTEQLVCPVTALSSVTVQRSRNTEVL